MAAIDRYNEKLRNPRPPGTGCHPWILGTATLGVLGGLGGDQIYSDIRQAIPQGSRRIPDREIQEAIRKALADHTSGTFTARTSPTPVVQDGKAALLRIIAQGKIAKEADLRECSPIQLGDEPKSDLVLLLEAHFKQNELVWIGDRLKPGIMGNTIRTTEEWIAHYLNGGSTEPLIIINPLNGIPAPTKNGNKTTLRGDGNVADFRFCLVEFDNLNREDQLRFWSAAKLPIVALIDSGGKSIHAWLEVSKLSKVATSEQWATEIKGRLYDRILTPLGVDGACSNPSRLSRLPGHYRAEKGRYQRLLWLAPEGKPIS
jgi:hypothetical protein